MGSKRLNYVGFVSLALNFAAMAICYMVDPDQKTLLFVLFCSLTFFLSFGPNLGTFVLPAICFPAHIRSTCHGLSAFSGKLGAVVGTLAFPAITESSIGLPGVLWVQAGFCIIGAVVSKVFLHHDWEYLSADSAEDRAATMTFIEGQGSVIEGSVIRSRISNDQSRSLVCENRC